jgi:hypothetical protein
LANGSTRLTVLSPFDALRDLNLSKGLSKEKGEGRFSLLGYGRFHGIY